MGIWSATAVNMSQNDLGELLVDALRSRVGYVDARDETVNDDDDVRALEDVAAVLQQVPRKTATGWRLCLAQSCLSSLP
jgi:hypothetical protein